MSGARRKRIDVPFEDAIETAAQGCRNTDTKEIGVLLTIGAHRFFIVEACALQLVDQLERAARSLSTFRKKPAAPVAAKEVQR